jgi:Helix-turn-helix domain/Bacterial regulatory proteins, gntR family
VHGNGDSVNPPLKYTQAAAIVRNQISDGTIKPGAPAPSGASLARLTGFSVLTCRKALTSLVRQGILIPGPSRSARPRVAPGPGSPPAERWSEAGRALARALADRRRAAGLTQPALATLTGVSVTTVGHAETGRLWQARAFWENADAALDAGGALATLHDAYRAPVPGPAETPETPEPPPSPAVLVSVVLCWSDGTVTTVAPPAQS